MESRNAKKSMSPLDAIMAQIKRGGEDLDVEALIYPPAHPARSVPSAALLDVLVRLAGPGADGGQILGELVAEAQRRGWSMAAAAPAASCAKPSGSWLTPTQADVQHGQVWTVRTRGGIVIPLAQLDGYVTESGRRYWRAVNLDTRRLVQVQWVLEGSCPRIGGRRERAKR